MNVSPRFEQFAPTVGLTLEPFQRRIVRAAFGAERELLVLLPRGNGKTTLIAAVALHHLLTVDGAAVYCAAASREQARIVFEYAAAFARALGHPHVVDRHLELRWCPDPRRPRVFTRHLRVLSADAPRLHGLTPSLAIVDELHAHPNEQVYLALLTALAKRPGSKLVTISSAGQGASSPLGRLRARALALPSVKRSGALTEAVGPNLRMLEWAVPEEASVDDMRAIKRANPASWITPKQLRAQREAVPDLAFRRFHCGQWTERAGHWLPPGAFQACVGNPVIAAGEDIIVGVDVGGERSSTAVVWATCDLRVGCWIGDGDEAVLDARDVVRELAERYSVREVVFDPWRAGQLAAELERERIRCVAFPQTDARMIPASAALHAAVVERRLTLPADDRLAQHAANTIARHSRRGWRIDKPDGRTPNDAIVALAMAVERAQYRPQPLQVVGWL